MARSIWNGTITFGLTTVPIKVHSATEDHAVHFHQVHAADGARITQKRLCSKDGKEVPFVSDYFDFSIYIDADEADIRRWYIERFMRLKETRFRDPRSYFHRYADYDEKAALSVAEGLWDRINLVNLDENIRPTRPRADLIIGKSADHTVREVALRKL